MSDEKKKSDEMGEGVCAGLLLAGMPFFLAYSGWALKTLWSWFVVPLGVVPLTLAQATGIGMICMLATARAQATQPKASQLLAFEVITPGGTVLIGWFVQRFF